MASSVVPGPHPRPTRRQIRHNQRAEEGAARRARFLTTPPAAAPPLPAPDLAAIAPHATPGSALHGRLTRRQLRESASVGRSRRSRASRLVVRGTVLVALAAVTIGVPIIDPHGADHSARAHSAEGGAAPVTPVQTSILQTLDAAAAATASDYSATSLLADPLAADRARAAQASRAAERGTLGPTSGTSANGLLAAVAPETRVVLPLPASSFRTTSSFGGRADPFTGITSTHTGVDLAAPLETPIYAVADGVVDYVGPGKAGRSSMLIVVRHEIDGQILYSWYNHMYPSGLYAEEGQQVSAGDVIAGVGNNGRSTGPHLHFEIHLDDELTTTDPLAWLEQQGATDVTQAR